MVNFPNSAQKLSLCIYEEGLRFVKVYYQILVNMYAVYSVSYFLAILRCVSMGLDTDAYLSWIKGECLWVRVGRWHSFNREIASVLDEEQKHSIFGSGKYHGSNKKKSMVYLFLSSSLITLIVPYSQLCIELATTYSFSSFVTFVLVSKFTRPQRQIYFIHMYLWIPSSLRLTWYSQSPAPSSPLPRHPHQLSRQTGPEPVLPAQPVLRRVPGTASQLPYCGTLPLSDCHCQWCTSWRSTLGQPVSEYGWAVE